MGGRIYILYTIDKGIYITVVIINLTILLMNIKNWLHFECISISYLSHFCDLENLKY